MMSNKVNDGAARRSATMKELLSKHLNGVDLPGTMALTLVVWLCSLVLVALIVLPLFGAKVAFTVAAALLLGSLALCWGICTYHVAKGADN
jgi:preprotein translocase subunit SecF